jgi:hypothetical protein
MITIYFGAKPTEISSQEGLFVLLAETIKEFNGKVELVIAKRHLPTLTRMISLNNWKNISVMQVSIFGKSNSITTVAEIEKQKSFKVSYFYKFLTFSTLRLSKACILLVAAITFMMLIPGMLSIPIVFLAIAFLIPPIRKMIKKSLHYSPRIAKSLAFKFWNLLLQINSRLNRIPHFYFIDPYYKFEQKIIANAVLQRNSNILYVPHLFSGDLVKKLHSRVKIYSVFPDLVTVEYPQYFPKNISFEKSMAKTLKYSHKIFTYSSYVRENHIPMEFHYKIVVNPHGWLRKELQLTPVNISSLISQISFPVKFSKPKFNEGLTKLIVIPTIDRPYKNILNAIKSAEIILKQDYEEIKVVLTTPVISDEIIDYIWEQKLHKDIIWMPNLSLNDLDFLISRSNLVLHPSLFEGGWIFNCMRAVNYGVPFLVHGSPTALEMFGVKSDRFDIYLNQDSESILLPGVVNCLDILTLHDAIQEVFREPGRFVKEQYEATSILRLHSPEAAAKAYFLQERYFL